MTHVRLVAILAIVSMASMASAGTMYITGTASSGNAGAEQKSDGNYWNTVYNPYWTPSDNTILNLVDTGNGATGITFSALPDASNPNYCTGWDNTNSNGPATVTGDAAEFAPASTVTSYTTRSEVVMLLSGLNTSMTYDFTFFASRYGSADSDRSVDFDVAGLNSGTGSVDAGNNNTSNVATILGISPDASGEITITVTKGATNGSGYSYLNAWKITEVPEPASMSLLGLGGLAALIRRRRK